MPNVKIDDLTATPSGLTATMQLEVDVSGTTAYKTTGQEILDFVAGKVDSGSTLPTSPTDGQTFLHTPTGRTWLMVYTTSEGWSALKAFGSSTIYVDDSVNGSQDWDEGDTTGTRWDLEWITPKLPPQRGGNIDLYLASRTFDTGDKLVVPAGLSGAGKIRFIGATTDEVASTTFSSSSGSYQSWTMSATVSAGSRGDIVQLVSGTEPGSVEPFGEDYNDWVFLSRSGTNLQIAGGVCSSAVPDNTSVFKIMSRDSILPLTDVTFLDVQSANVEFLYIEFTLGTAQNIWETPLNLRFIGCSFLMPTSGGTLRGINNWQFIACYFEKTAAGGAQAINCLTSTPHYLFRCLVYSTRNSNYTIRLQGRTGNGYTEILGTRVWNTNSGRVLIQNSSKQYTRFQNITFDDAYVVNYFVVGGGSADYMETDTLALVGADTSTFITATGSSGSLSNVDAATFSLSV